MTLSVEGQISSLQYDAVGRLSAVTNPFGRGLGEFEGGFNRLGSAVAEERNLQITRR